MPARARATSSSSTASIVPIPRRACSPTACIGPSEVVPRDFEWHDAAWRGVALEDYVVYELHVGTFTHEGTFDAVIARLDALKELGITAIELLPIAQFPGTSQLGLRRRLRRRGAELVRRSARAEAARRRLSRARPRARSSTSSTTTSAPRGTTSREYGPYFTDRYKTPWGLALNFDGPHSDRRALVLHPQRAAMDRRVSHRRTARRRRARHRRSLRRAVPAGSDHGRARARRGSSGGASTRSPRAISTIRA